ncbi:MAG: hypothetical protein AAF333_09350 [Planctomycetota bacterium]
MPKNKHKIKNTPPSGKPAVCAARPLPPDDVRVGDDVTVAHVTVQILAHEDPPPGEDRNRLLRARMIPDYAGTPLRIEEVCLPFVVARTPQGGHGTLDLRRHHLYRLDEEFTRRAFKRLTPKDARKRKRKRKNG